jgi:hypothetical protein
MKYKEGKMMVKAKMKGKVKIKTWRDESRPNKLFQQTESKKQNQK